MNYRALRMTTCCLVSAFTLAATPVIAGAAPIAGASGLTNANVASELTASSPASGISLALSQYLAENSISVNGVAKQMTDTQTVTASEAVEPAAEAEPEKTGEKKVMIVAQVEGYVNVRARADEDSKVLGKLYDDSVGTVIKEVDGWYKIRSGTVKGFVKAEYVKVANKKLLRKVGTRIATVDTQTLRVRDRKSVV